MSSEPTYGDALNEIDAVSEKMTPATRKLADKAMGEKMADSETVSTLLNEVKALSVSTKKVYDAFVEISTGLGEIDKKGYNDEHGKPLAKLKPQWDGFRTRMVKLVWESRDAATDTASYAKEFKDAYLPAIDELIVAGEKDPSKWTAMVDGIHGSLKKFAERPNPALAKSPHPVPPGADPYTVAEAHSQAFLDLKRDVTAFKDTFASFVKYETGELTGKIAELTREINALIEEIAMYDKLIKKLGDAIGITIEYKGKIADAAAASLGSLGPAAKAGVLIIGAYAVIGEVKALTRALQNKATAQTQLEKKRAEKAEAERNIAQLLQMLSKLEAQPANLNEVISRLDQIANIWSLIQSNVKDISDILGGTMTEDFFSVLKNQVAILKANHNMLYEALKLYASKVTDSGIPPA